MWKCTVYFKKKENHDSLIVFQSQPFVLKDNEVQEEKTQGDDPGSYFIEINLFIPLLF